MRFACTPIILYFCTYFYSKMQGDEYIESDCGDIYFYWIM